MRGLLIACLILLSGSAFPASLGALPFQVGERLEFEISWLGVPAGYSLLEVKGMEGEGGRSVFEIESRTWSNRFVSTFFRVDDRIECLMEAGDLTGRWLKVRQREGGHQNDKEIHFDQAAGRAKYIKNGRVTQHDVPPQIRDSLSSFYYLRTRRLEEGKDLVIDTFSNGKLYKVTVKVLGRETLKIGGEEVSTVKVQPLMSQNDVFNNKGEIFFWLTDDEFKVPVRIRSEISIGYFTADIINFKKGEYYGNRSGTVGHTRLSEVQR